MQVLDYQLLFAKLFGLLMMKAQQMGYGVVLGEIYRSPEEVRRLAGVGIGHPKSLHGLCLAGHLELFEGRTYLEKTVDYMPLGEWWEQQHSLCRWGGRFTDPSDGHHFSITFDGRA